MCLRELAGRGCRAVSTRPDIVWCCVVSLHPYRLVELRPNLIIPFLDSTIIVHSVELLSATKDSVHYRPVEPARGKPIAFVYTCVQQPP